LKKSSLNFRVVVCRIRLFPTLISKIKWLGSKLPLKSNRLSRDKALSVSYERNPVVNEKCDPFESLELCYGTANGTVRVLVQSPEHHGHHGLRSLQLLQTYKVHSSPITSVELSEKFLISCCSRRHVRTWSMTRFRGVLSTQPGSVPFSDFELTSQAQIQKHQYGPFGDQSEIPIFIQQPIQVGFLAVILTLFIIFSILIHCTFEQAIQALE